MQVREQARASQEDVKQLVQLRALPRELLLQQTLLLEKGTIECFHCAGKGSKSPAARPIGHAEKVKDVFERMDADGNGLISRDELAEALEVMGRDSKLGRKHIDVLMANFDKDDDGQIDFHEFVSWLFMPGYAHSKFRDDLGRSMLPRVVWLYREGRGSWNAFDRKMAATLNAAHAEGVGAAVRVKAPSFEYIVDLTRMVQVNQATGREREIMRLSDGSSDTVVDWFVPGAKWFCCCGKERIPYEPSISAALEAAWQARACGSLDTPMLPLSVKGHVYEFDVEKMTQRNPKSGKSRRLCREVGARDPRRGEDLEEPILLRVPTGVKLDPGTCWVCRGSGHTSKFLEPLDGAEEFDDLAPDEGELPDCLVCYADVATYGVSTKCSHFFCDDCIRGSLEAIMDSGQFPAFCPMCRAESGGPEPENGRIDEAALTFLQQRGVITKAFQFRFEKQQNKALEVETLESFECPGKCGEFLVATGPYCDEHKIGEHFTDPASGTVGIRLGECPSCSCFVCIKCQVRVPQEEGKAAPMHRCEGDAPVAAEPDAASLALMAAIGKMCPVCGAFIEKNEGCDWMMCGTKAHGSLQEVIRNAGCGIAFLWSNLQVGDDPCGWDDLDGSKKRGRPVTALQLRGRGHPKCKREGCNRFKTVDGLGPGLPWHTGVGTQGQNNGGDYCCDKCGVDGSHQVFCHNIAWRP